MSFIARYFNPGDIPYLLYPVVPLPWMCFLARMDGRFNYLIRRQDRATVKNNLSEVFGQTKSPGEINTMTRQFFEYKQLRTLLLFLSPKLRPAHKSKLFPVEGLEHLDHALSQNKGVVLIGSHLNSLVHFIAKDMLRTQGYDVRIAIPTEGAPYPPTLFHRMIDRLSMNKTRTIQEGLFYAQFNIRPIVRCLSENAAVTLLGDGEHSAGFVKVEFLGRPVLLTTGALSVARLTGSPALPFFMTGSPPENLKIVIEEPIPLVKSENSRRDLETMVSRYAQRLEYYLLQDIPCWMHWLNDHALDQMAHQLEESLKERYHV